MQRVIKVPYNEVRLINDLLNLTGDEIYQKYGYKRDETIVYTAVFNDNIEVDIKLVICDGDAKPYTEGILFSNGAEIQHTDPDDTYIGEWEFEVGNEEYIVIVKPELTENQRKELCQTYNNSDINSIDYMYNVLRDAHNPEMLDILKQVRKLNRETTLGIGIKECTIEDAKKYIQGKETLLNYFGIKIKNGTAYIE